MKRWRNIILGLVLSGVFLWVALRGLDWQSMGAILQTTRWGYLLVAMGIWSIGLGTRAIRWRVLLGNTVSPRATFHILNIGFLINNTLPFRVGELARAYLVGRSDAATSGWAALTTIVAERIIDMLAVVILLVLVIPALAVEQATITGGLVMGGIAV
ncbi:MAG: flippase-like domain-containing protein, partial [Anaerolineae bacterium]|nr:flippase-like domain-containing protein [Anaerolineae bacterium]